MQIVDRRRRGPVALALAGGGPEGAVYEIGALHALNDALDGFDPARAPLYVGVSAGAFVASCLANGISTAQLCRSVVAREPGEQPFDPGLFLTPAFGEFARRGLSVPGHVLGALRARLTEPDGAGGLLSALTDRLGRAVPVGFFDNRPIRDFLERTFALRGRTNDFRRLPRKLFVVASDLDSGEAVVFGGPGLERVPVSQAVQASTALPGLYPPVEIGGRHYVDGVLIKTLHASVALDQGAGLVLCVNPIVPVDAAAKAGVGPLSARGLPAVMSQTLRAFVRSRLHVGLAAYEHRYDAADVLLFEPGRDDYRMFFSNVFSFANRRKVVEHAYRSTLTQLASRQAEVEVVLRHHGIQLRTDLLARPETWDLWSSVGLPEEEISRSYAAPARRLQFTLNRLRRELDGVERGQARRLPPESILA